MIPVEEIPDVDTDALSRRLAIAAEIYAPGGEINVRINGVIKVSKRRVRQIIHVESCVDR